MHARFYVPGVRAGEPVALPPEEAEHLVRVLRAGPGDQIAVFDGTGCEMLATVETITRRSVVVRPTARLEPAPEPSVRLSLALAVTRADRMDSAVRDAAMMGAKVVQPVLSARSETTAAVLARTQRTERWRRIAVSSVKQCGRAVVPDVREPLAFGEYLRSEDAEMKLLLVEPRAGGGTALAGASRPESAALAIGPEGGWTPEEIDVARRAGFHGLTLGQRTLRADAMPIAAIAVLQFVWEDL